MYRSVKHFFPPNTFTGLMWLRWLYIMSFLGDNIILSHHSPTPPRLKHPTVSDHKSPAYNVPPDTGSQRHNTHMVTGLRRQCTQRLSISLKVISQAKGIGCTCLDSTATLNSSGFKVLSSSLSLKKNYQMYRTVCNAFDFLTLWHAGCLNLCTCNNE